MAIPSASHMQNNTGGNGQYVPLARKKNESEEEKHFSVDGSLKDFLDSLDDTNIRTRFAQTSDPIYLAFQHIESKPLKMLAKEFMEDAKHDIASFISGVFSF